MTDQHSDVGFNIIWVCTDEVGAIVYFCFFFAFLYKFYSPFKNISLSVSQQAEGKTEAQKEKC